MKWLGISVALLLSSFLSAAAQTLTADSTNKTDNDELFLQKMERRKEVWSNFIPNSAIGQFAGNIGLVEAGTGWSYGKHDRWETQFLLGYVPKFKSGENDFTLTLRENLALWQVDKNNMKFIPGVFSLTFSSILNDKYWFRMPEKYPMEGYYWLKTRLRTQIGFGERLTFVRTSESRRNIEAVSIYYQLDLDDIGILSAIPNKQVTLYDIVHFGCGVIFHLNNHTKRRF